MKLAIVGITKHCVRNECLNENPQPIENFYVSKHEKDGKCRYCKQCSSWYSKSNREKFYDKTMAKQKEYRLRTRYGISIEQWDAMYLSQGGCCKICGAHASELKKSLATDHCHGTGAVRGLLCESCNLLVGYAKDDPEILRGAALYLSDFK